MTPKNNADFQQPKERRFFGFSKRKNDGHPYLSSPSAHPCIL